MRLLVIVAMFVFNVVAAQADSPVVHRPVTDFAKLPFLQGPELSPNGRKVAAKLAMNGKQVLAIIDLFGRDKRPPIAVSVGENDLISWQWVNDDWLVIGVAATIWSAGDQFYVTRLAGVNVDGKTFKPIAYREGGTSARLIWVARDGSPRILIARQRSIFYNDPDFGLRSRRSMSRLVSRFSLSVLK